MRVFAVALLLAFAGCHLGGDKDPKALIARLEDKDPRARIQALQQLRKLGVREAAPRIARLLREPETRAEAALALSDLGGPEQVQPLLDALDPGADARDNEAIARALGTLADPRATPALSKLVDDPTAPPAVIGKALLALGQIGDPAALPALLHGLCLEPNRVSLLSESSLALVMIGAPAVEPLLQIAEEKNPAYISWAREQGRKTADVYARVALVLGDLGDARAVPALRKKLKYVEPAASAAAARPLTNLVRMFAASALGRLRAVEAAKEVQALVSTTDDEDEGLSTAAAEALVWIGDRSQARELLAKSKAGKLRLRLLAAQSAALFGEPRLGRDILELAMKEAKGAQPACLAELRALNLPEVDPARACDLVATQFGELSHPLEAARVCASDVPCWLPKLRDQDPVVRARAAYELGRAGAANAVSELTKATADEQVLVRIAAARALEWLSAVPAARADLKIASRALAQRLSPGSATGASMQVDEDLRRLQLKLSRL
jgi:HEAT repeat protein